MTIADIIDGVNSREKTLTVYNDDEPEPIVQMLKRMVDAEDVTIRETDVPADTPGNVVILEDDGQEQLAISSIADVGDSVLMVNSDLYVTGAREIDQIDTPSVLTGMDETTFRVSGKQKMLMMEISRHVEALAYRSAGSRLHAGFQYLSRIEDERGTKRVYERLAGADADVHLYGVPNSRPNLPDEITVHADEGRTSSFVVRRER